MIKALTLHFYVKITFASILLILIAKNIVKTIDGVNKGLRTITPAIVTIYFLFSITTILSIVLTILDT